jgi:hypothetical protein
VGRRLLEGQSPCIGVKFKHNMHAYCGSGCG